MKINIQLNSLLYNNDKEALEELLRMDKKYEIFNNKVKKSIVNNFEVDIEIDDMVDTLLKKLNIDLFERITYQNNKDNKTCLYCFKEHKNNEIINLKSKSKKGKDLKELLDLDIDLDLDEFDLSDDEELDDLFKINGGSKKNDKIFVCYNCMKVYYFNDYFKIEKTFKDIFPYQNAFYLYIKDITLQHSYYKKKNKTKVYDLDFPINLYDDLDKVNDEYIKNNKMLNIDSNIIDEKMIINSNGFEILEKVLTKNDICNFDLISTKKINIDMIYLPDSLLYYKKNKYKNIEIYLERYFPFIDLKTYYENFFDDKYISLKKKRSKIEIDYSVDKNYLSWVNSFELKSKNFELFENIKGYQKQNIYISKIFYEVLDEKNKDLDIINFKNILHLIDLDEKLIFINMYNPINNKYIKKIYKEKEEYIKEKNWDMNKTDLVQFKLLLPVDKSEYYININLYKNTKMNITISLPMNSNIYISENKINEINRYINKYFIKRLNSKNIFNYNFKNFKLKEINEKSSVCNISKKNINYKINTINFYFNMGKDIDINQIKSQIDSLEKCLSLYYIIDQSSLKSDIRYVRSKNISMGSIIDKEIYNTYINFGINNININNQIIENIMDKFKLSYLESKQYLNTYLFLNKNFELKPTEQGIYLSFIEKDNLTIFNCLGCRSYKVLNKLKVFMFKLSELFNQNMNNKLIEPNIKSIVENCSINKEFKKLLFNANKTTLKQIEKFKCMIDLNKSNNKSKIKKRISILDKSINDDIKIYNKINKKSVKYITRLQDTFNNLKFTEDKEDKNYSKQCQKSRQPMGTGEGFPPEIINYDRLNELKRFELFNNVKCNINTSKIGGAKLVKRFDNVYMNWGRKNNIKKYPKKMNILKCGIKSEDNYKKQDLIKIAKELGIELKGKYDKNIVCFDIRKKLSENYKKYLTENISILEDKLNDKKLTDEQVDKIEDMLENLEFKLYFKYSKYLNNNIDISNKEIINLSRKFNFKNASRMNKKTFKTLIVEYAFTKLNEDKIKKLMLSLGFNRTIKELAELNMIIARIQYDIYNLFKSWDKKEEKIMNDNFKWKEGDNIKDKIYNFEKKYIEFVSFDKDENNEYINEISKLSNEINLLLNTQDGKIIQSTLNFKGKSISCPNFEDASIENNLVGFLDIPVSLIPSEMSENEIRNKYCKPCCFKSTFDKNGELIIQSNYKRNNLFCTKKMSWNDYIDDINDSKRIDNYISSYSNKYNLKNTFGHLPYNLHNLLNNYINLYNEMENAVENDNLFDNYTNNILKSPGFVLTGNNNIKNSFKKSLGFVLDFDYLKEIIIAIKNNEKLFNSLNQGDISLKFKTINEYIKYLKSDDIEPEYIVDILSRENIFKKYPYGFNLFIFEEDSELKIVKYNSLYINQIDINKSKILMYKYNTEVYEPIVLFNNMKYITIFDDDTIKNTKYIKNKKVLISLFDFITDWYDVLFRPTYETIDDIVELYKKNTIKYQIIDEYQKTLFLVLKDNILIPVHPQGFIEGIETKKYNKNIEKYIKILRNLESDLKKYSKIIDDNSFLIKNVIVENNMMVAVELKNGLLVPIIKQKYSKNIKYSKSKNINYLKINSIIKNGQNILGTSFEEVINNYDDELYKTFRLYVSNNLKENEKNSINKIIKELEKLKRDKINVIDINKYYKKIKNIIIKSMVNNINYISSRENIDKFIIEDKNVRENCLILNKDKCSKSTFCSFINNKCKINIPKNKKEIFVNYLTNDILNNHQLRDSILNKSLDIIIDDNKFSSDESHKILMN